MDENNLSKSQMKRITAQRGERLSQDPLNGRKTMSKSLVLRVCGSKGESHGAFVWPLEVGVTVKAPDWRKNHECGNGLHGWLYGQGDHTCTDRWQNADAKWIVVEVESDSIIELGGKVKYPEGIVRFAGDSKSATDYLWENEPRSRDVLVIGACRADKRDGAQVKVWRPRHGHGGRPRHGHGGRPRHGHGGRALGTATAGYSGTATAGALGTATAGLYGVIAIEYYDSKRDVYRRKVGEIDGETLKAGVAYRLNDANEFVEANGTK